MRFRDRADAGRRLAAMMVDYRGDFTRVFGLDGGGLRVGYEVAQALAAPLDVWMARGVESPEQGGRAVGAVSEGEGLFLDIEGIRSAVAPAAELARWMDAEAGEVALAAQHLRGGHPRLEAAGCTALLVVDGIAVGDVEVYAALRGLRRQGPRRVVLAAPVASAEELERLRLEADEVQCLHPVWALLSIQHAYDSFPACQDLEVRQFLERAREIQPGREALVPGPAGEWI